MLIVIKRRKGNYLFITPLVSYVNFILTNRFFSTET
jgi:hypothetical protein